MLAAVLNNLLKDILGDMPGVAVPSSFFSVHAYNL
jgi:hypothetical protein